MDSPKIFRPLKHHANKRNIIIAICFILISAMATSHFRTKEITVDPASYRPLLDLIARVESRSNYNAYFGNPHNSDIDFTQMTISEVLEWQANYIQQGAASSAVGRYQIINTTLAELVEKLQIDTNTKFDAQLQDKLAIALLERRGSHAYARGDISKKQFAAELAKEWAALPRTLGTNPTHSYYTHDGLNAAIASIDEVLASIEHIRLH